MCFVCWLYLIENESVVQGMSVDFGINALHYVCNVEMYQPYRLSIGTGIFAYEPFR